MMNDTTNENNGKNTYTNSVPQLLVRSLLRSYFTSKIFHFFFQQIKASTQKFSHAMMRQLLLRSILLSYFTSKIFRFFFQQIKASTRLVV